MPNHEIKYDSVMIQSYDILLALQLAIVKAHSIHAQVVASSLLTTLPPLIASLP